MAKSNSSEWAEFNRQILDKLDIEAEYKAVGVETIGGPTHRGWVSCRAFGKDDRNPSAGINVGSAHPQRGRYKEFTGEGRNLSFFEFLAIANAPGHEQGWEGVRNELAKRLGMEPPKSKKTKRPEESIDFRDYNANLVQTWCRQHKQGVNHHAVKAVGGRLAVHYDRFNVIALPVYGPNLLDDEPCGWIAWALNGKPLPIFQGKDRPPLWKKVKSLVGSESGLIGEWGIRYLESAEFVWTPEGPSDLLAIQSIIPRELIRKHSVIANSGGTMEVLRKEILTHFSGKSVIVPMDCDLDGWRGGWRRARDISEFASEVRALRLPFRITEKHGPDIRDYVSGLVRPCSVCIGTGNISMEHDSIPVKFEELSDWKVRPRGDCPVCEGLGIAKPESPEDLKMPLPTFETIFAEAMRSKPLSFDKTPEAAADEVDEDSNPLWKMICDDLKIVVDGKLTNDGRKVQAWSITNEAFVELDHTRLSYEDMVSCCGSVASRKIHLGKDDVPGMYRMTQVREALAGLGGKSDARRNARGQGCWPGEDVLIPDHPPIVLVGAGQAAVFNGKGVLEKFKTPFVSGITADIDSELHWFDDKKLDHYLAMANDDKWCADTVDRLISLTENWYWKQGMAPHVVSGLILATWVQSLWTWRPLVSIVGESDSGKSSFFAMLASIFGNLSLLTSKSNATGLRQSIDHHSCVVLCDEFESDKYRREIMEFFRTSSQGSFILRGTPDQRGKKFGLKHIVWVAAIEVDMPDEADWNRFISLDLKKPPADKRGKLSLPSKHELADFGQRLLAISIKKHYQAREYARKLQGVVVPGVHGRIVESFSVPVAILAVASGISVEDACTGLLPNILESFKFNDKAANVDQDQLFHSVLESWVSLGRGDSASVSQILDRPDDYHGGLEALAKAGIAMVSSQKGRRYDGTTENDLLFIAPSSVKRYLLGNTNWQYKSIQTFLERLPGAVVTQRRIAGSAKHGVTLPLDYVRREFMDETSKQKQIEFPS